MFSPVLVPCATSQMQHYQIASPMSSKRNTFLVWERFPILKQLPPIAELGGLQAFQGQVPLPSADLMQVVFGLPSHTVAKFYTG